MAFFLPYTVSFPAVLSHSFLQLLSAFPQLSISFGDLSSPPPRSLELRVPLGSSAVGTWHFYYTQQSSKKLWTSQFLCAVSNLCDWQLLLFQSLSELSWSVEARSTYYVFLFFFSCWLSGFILARFQERFSLAHLSRQHVLAMGLERRLGFLLFFFPFRQKILSVERSSKGITAVHASHAVVPLQEKYAFS